MIAVLAVALFALAAPAIAAPPYTVAQGGVLRGQLPAGADGLTLDGRPVATDAAGRWIVGIGRDAAGEAWLGWFDTDGETGETIAITPRTWAIESIPGLPARPVDSGSDAEFAARRAPELARIAAVRAAAIADPAAAGTGWAEAFVAPAAGPVSGVFGSQRILGGTPQSPHAGIDLGAPAGAPALAPAAGIVRLAGGPYTLEGNLVMIDHGGGVVSALLHLSRIDVLPGQFVARGEAIGAVGATGRATGPHLHWGVTVAGVRVDPAALLELPDGR